ncbi:non-homologous end-joining DNA ligase [Rhabdothermincola salaria]|uniref:non-homologous end-joining DNA ligase n=1 Tax=Rhabdothermincola salaria TaxID=2903142 RepID=UPI001E5C615E|nr:non-homologous end-joining DNA ligase [Rhabdothermincola salaria]MCD9625383.1 non-homologous end-joining DNA ligase [Rhabdothermincola salaria]
MPAPVVPMKAVATDQLPPDDDRWAFEVKWDGMRVVAEVRAATPGGDEGALRLWSASGSDATDRFPELAGLPGAVHEAGSVVLDGEVVALDPTSGRPEFGLLQPRIQATTPGAVQRAAARQSVQYIVFDVVSVDDQPLLDHPYRDRRSRLEELLEAGPNWRVGPSQRGDGELLLDAVRRQGLEGVVAKRIDSPYVAGSRSSAWRKIKVRLHQELVVGGWLPGEGGRVSTFGAVLVGYRDPPAHGAEPAGPLRYAGRVGTGFRQRDLITTLTELERRQRPNCPFDPPPPAPVARLARWVDPTLVAEVAHAEWTRDGVLRHPSFLGWRTDKDPSTIGRTP